MATPWTLVMLYNLLMMHRDEAGMPMEAPRVIRVAMQKESWLQFVKRCAGDLTNITPDWCFVNRVVGPNHGVYALIEAG